MPVSGLVLTLAEDRLERQGALDALAAIPDVTLGDLSGIRLPVVTESDTLTEHHRLWKVLEEIEGVHLVQIAFHDFSDADDLDVPLPRRHPREGG